jgi:hypothetical protein
MLYRIINSFMKPKLSEEAFWAYYHRLPQSIEVRWFRDGNYIIGEIHIDKKKYLTQGKNAEDFIDMVNDLVVDVFDVPKDYVGMVKSHHTYSPPKSEEKKLKDTSVSRANFGFRKKTKECLRYA